MAEYVPGMRVVIRGEEWKVQKVERNALGHDALSCVGITPLVRERESIFLSDLENIEIVDPAKVRLVEDNSAQFARSLLYLESQWRQQIPTDTRLHIGHLAAMDPMPYQLEPAAQALEQPRARILIADAVGLGKTLEAGILMSELIARGKGKRILVVTTKSMLGQFQKEMWNRFTIPLVRLDSQRIARIRSELPSNYNPFYYYDKTIISVDTLKRDMEFRTHLEAAEWDIIVIDEAQNVAERGEHLAQRARLAKLLANDRSDTLILLSATPHDGRAKSFASLMNMLDPTAIANPDKYGPDEIKGLFIRRFKKDIQEQAQKAFSERQIFVQECRASKKEERAFDIFADMRLEMDGAREEGNTGWLFKTTLEKALFSSPAACSRSIDERLKKTVRKYGEKGSPDMDALRELKKAVDAIDPEDFSRYQELLQLLRSDEYDWDPTDPEDRLVIFTERIETMKYLAERLQVDMGLAKNMVEIMCGSMSDSEQQRIVEDFGRKRAPVRLLVASDVASEGLNLHFLSHRLIHFDIPWSLMVFQQRNGRIDRYGQSHRPDIRYLVVHSQNKKVQGDLHILRVLIEKENEARRNIGDPTLLMGKFSVEGEELVVAEAMETGMNLNEAENILFSGPQEREMTMLELLLGTGDAARDAVQPATDETLYSDMAYLKKAIRYLGSTAKLSLEDLKGVSGVDIRMTQDLERRMRALMPEEAFPKKGVLRVSDDRQYCQNEMRRCAQSSLADSAWPSTQYLWKLHPLLAWVNDKLGLLFARNEAPCLCVPDKLNDGEMIFVVNGSIPNEKSTPLVDEWFGLRYQDGQFAERLEMEDVVRRASLRSTSLYNSNAADETVLAAATQLLPDVVGCAKRYLHGIYEQYQERMEASIDQELDKLDSLRKRHQEHLTATFEEKEEKQGGSKTKLERLERERAADERSINDMFDRFADRVKTTMTIQDNPYLKIVAVLAGGAQ